MDKLARIIAEDLLAFAYCREYEMDEDFSLAQLERVAGQLRVSGRDVVNQFIGVVRKMQQEALDLSLDQRAEQLASLPELLGLED